MVTAEQIEKNIIPASYERPAPGKIKYAGLKYPTEAGVKDLYATVFNRYVPRIPLKTVSQEVRARNGWTDLPEEIEASRHEVETGEFYQRATGNHKAGDPKTEIVAKTETTMVPDPDVIWVGRITDGLLWCEAMPVISPHRVASRKLLKDFLHNVPAGDNGTEARCSMTFIRDGQEFSFGPRLLDTEPGEITNSPHSIAARRDPNEDLDLSAPRYEEREFEPRIRRYPDFDLHYLKRGDRVVYQGQGWPRPRTNGGEPWRMEFVLRPPSEGPSLVQSGISAGNTVRLI